jgi:uncharacterized membrane protein YdbT with pleckstrin-like domain
MTRGWRGATDTVWAMSYPKKLLNDYEELAVDLHPHWLYFFEAVFALVAAIVLGIVVVAMDSPSALKWIVLFLILASAVWVVVRYLKWVTTNFVITSDRVIFRHGVFAKSGIEIPLERVNSVHFSQSIIERLVGAGDLLIESGAEGGQQRFTDVHDPDKIQNLIHAQMEQNEKRMFQVQHPGASPAAVTDVMERLERLEAMHERGTLTAAEFEAQKQRLLNE